MPSQPYFQSAFSLDEFRRRREQLCDAIGDSHAVLQGAAASGAMDLFRQDNNFFYLCGVETPHAYLTLDGRSGEATLYLPPIDRRMAEIEGPELNADEPDIAKRLTGVDLVKPLWALADDLRGASMLYASLAPAEGRMACQDSLRDAQKLRDLDPWRDHASPANALVDTLRRRLPGAEVRDLSPLLVEMRRLKTPAEIAVMRHAGQITAAALCEAVRCTQPGVIESELVAAAHYVFLLNGATGGAYRAIAASGENIWNMHYFRNHSRLVDGELVLFDYAPDLSCYTSDIGRMWPVNGKYAPWQRDLYGFVVDYHQALLELIEPGKTPGGIRTEAADRLGPLASRINWSRPAHRDAVEKLLKTSRACTHTVGMAVHDQSGYQHDDHVLAPGLVFALDPQLWAPEERVYIRVEDNVVVTDDGVESFTQTAPLSLDETEALMREEGLLQSRPDLLLPSA